jgi:hypothetical protein
MGSGNMLFDESFPGVHRMTLIPPLGSDPPNQIAFPIPVAIEKSKGSL